MFTGNKSSPPAPGAFFPWPPELKLGIRQFDLEHQQLGALISQLHSLMVIKRDRPGADQVTDVLIQATRAHFASEEALLTQHGYPKCEEHCLEHSKLLAELLDLQRQFKAGTLSALAMPNFLRKWLVEHIQNTDQQYLAHLKEKGIR